MINQNMFACLPKVDQVLNLPAVSGLLQSFPRTLVLQAVRQIIEQKRQALALGQGFAADQLVPEFLVHEIDKLVRQLAKPSLQPVVNATGVVLHTNLGRSLLPERALSRLLALSRTYSNLEYDLQHGHRGSRYVHVEGLLRELTNAPAAMVVNNNAAAVYLCLQTFAAGRQVVVSRGQLVEIGGSFRIPDVMRASGAILHEVGTTNKTHLSDYELALSADTALILKVHTSNFAVVGFEYSVPLEELSILSKKHQIPLMEDLGSGSLLDLTTIGLPPEPTVTDSLAKGVDILTLSGDKLLGGPQAGIILGQKHLIEQLRKNPLNRALRIDKLTLAALEATLELYRDPRQALTEIPTLAMLNLSLSQLSRRAHALAAKLRAMQIPQLKINIISGASLVGGGALPLALPATRLVQVEMQGVSADALAQNLRFNDPAIIVRLEKDRLLMDPRTLQKGDDAIIASALHRLAHNPNHGEG